MVEGIKNLIAAAMFLVLFILLFWFGAVAFAEECDPCALGCPGVCEDFIPTPGCFVPGAECGEERIFIDCDFPREVLYEAYGPDVGFLCDDGNALFEELGQVLGRSQRKSRRIQRLLRKLRECRKR